MRVRTALPTREKDRKPIIGRNPAARTNPESAYATLQNGMLLRVHGSRTLLHLHL